MDTTATQRAIEAIAVLYVRDEANNTFGVVCDPSVPVTQNDLSAAIEEIGNLGGVYSVTQDVKNGHTVINVHFNSTATTKHKTALFEFVAPKFVLGKAWGNVMRKDGHHVNTFLRIDVARWAAPAVVAKLNSLRQDGVIAQFSTVEEYTNSRYITGIGFSLPRPTRDIQLNREETAKVAEKLGVMLEDRNFAIDENLAYAAVPEYNRPGDPIDPDGSPAS